MNLIPIRKQTGIEAYVNLNLVVEKIKDVIFCNRCGFSNYKKDVKIYRNESWSCLSCGRKSKTLEIEKVSDYFLKLDDLITLVSEKLNSFDLKFIVCENYFLITHNKNSIPIFLNELLLDVSLKYEALESNSIILTLSQMFQRKASVYEKPNILLVDSFIKIEKEKFIALLGSFENNLSIINYTKIKNKLQSYQEELGWDTFEEKLTELFIIISKNEVKMKELLNYFRKNINNPTGSKFILIGGNYRVDIRPIVLFEYLNKFLEINSKKSFEAKCYTGNLTESVYDKKIRTNESIPIMFVTNTTISPKLWERVFRAKDNNGDWWSIFVDNDILILFLIKFELEEEFFKK